MTFTEQHGYSKRAKADHELRATTAERRASLLARGNAVRPDTRSILERVRRWLRRG